MAKKFLQNVIGAVVAIVIALIVTPIYIKAIGAERYGLLALIWVMLGYLGIFDFGMSRSSTNALARIDEKDLDQTGRVFATALAINTALGIVGSLIILLLGERILLSAHALSGEVRGELQSAMIWVAPILPLTLASGISIGAFDARERFLISNLLQVTSNSLGLLVPAIVALRISPHLTAILPALFWTRFLSTLVMLSFNVLELGTFKVLKFDRQLSGKLLHFGGWVSVTNLVSPLMTSLDQFVIGGILGARPVAYYAVPGSAAARLQLFGITLAKTLFPLFSRAEKAEAVSVAEDALLTLSFLSVIVYAPGIAVLTPLLIFWLGHSFASSALQIAPILFFSAWINGLAVIPYSLIQGQGRPDIVAKLHLCEVLPYCALLWLFIHGLGLVGVAIASGLRVVADFVALWIVSGIPSRIAVQLLSSFALLFLGLVTNAFSAALGLPAQFFCATVILAAAIAAWFFQDPMAKKVAITVLGGRFGQNPASSERAAD